MFFKVVKPREISSSLFRSSCRAMWIFPARIGIWFPIPLKWVFCSAKHL